jgi:uncharacterized membrane protein SirB2
VELIKTIHVSCVVLSFSGFFIRGIWMMQESAQLKQRWTKILPHVVDTLLLTSAIILAVQWPLSPLQQPWLLAKIIALLVYVFAGMVALRFGRSKTVRVSAWIFGLLTFLYIVSVALSKSALGWLSHFQSGQLY